MTDQTFFLLIIAFAVFGTKLMLLADSSREEIDKVPLETHIGIPCFFVLFFWGLLVILS